MSDMDMSDINMSDIKKPTKYSRNRQLGNVGEDLAEMFLVKHGYKIIERNYLKKWGEIDIVAKFKGLTHFIEVKSQVTRESRDKFVSRGVSRISFTGSDFTIAVSHETSDHGDSEDFDPEENMNYWKQRRFIRALETYIAERDFPEDWEWQIDIVTVRFDLLKMEAIIKHIENVVLDV